MTRDGKFLWQLHVLDHYMRDGKSQEKLSVGQLCIDVLKTPLAGPLRKRTPKKNPPKGGFCCLGKTASARMKAVTYAVFSCFTSLPAISIGTFLPATDSGSDMLISSTPFSYLAVILSLSTPLGSVRLR